MANKSIHCKIGIVDQYGNIVTISPQTTGDDVYIKENQFKKGTTLQTLVDNLGNIAFTNDFLGINDNDTNNEYKTWSTSKILSEYQDIDLINIITVNEFKEKCNIILNKIQELDGSASPTDSIQTLRNKIHSISNKGTNAGNASARDKYYKGNVTAPYHILNNMTCYNKYGYIRGSMPIKVYNESMIPGVGITSERETCYDYDSNVETYEHLSINLTNTIIYDDIPNDTFHYNNALTFTVDVPDSDRILDMHIRGITFQKISNEYLGISVKQTISATPNSVAVLDINQVTIEQNSSLYDSTTGKITVVVLLDFDLRTVAVESGDSPTIPRYTITFKPGRIDICYNAVYGEIIPESMEDN